MKDNEKSPCLGCKDRWVNESGRCHSECERYAEYKAFVTERNIQINIERTRALSDPVKKSKTPSQLNYINKMRHKNR